LKSTIIAIYQIVFECSVKHLDNLRLASYLSNLIIPTKTASCGGVEFRKSSLFELQFISTFIIIYAWTGIIVQIAH